MDSFKWGRERTSTELPAHLVELTVKASGGELSDHHLWLYWAGRPSDPRDSGCTRGSGELQSGEEEGPKKGL